MLTCCLSLDGFVQQDDHTTMAKGADGITHPGGNHAMANQGDSLLICFPYPIAFMNCFVQVYFECDLLSPLIWCSYLSFPNSS
jgi:hypothetical protein